eukprot:TRINITY_DN35148_c0_g1_i1.p1 TRINITY_DN35148_c0_g1~~TRINITY_DN35148_c0_g1_i1.p1  ORF type:complete len:317 (+),score=36.14 TRINITY_DN35148_c0_g1_i1:53-1003(+)
MASPNRSISFLEVREKTWFRAVSSLVAAVDAVNLLSTDELWIDAHSTGSDTSAILTVYYRRSEREHSWTHGEGAMTGMFSKQRLQLQPKVIVSEESWPKIYEEACEYCRGNLLEGQLVSITCSGSSSSSWKACCVFYKTAFQAARPLQIEPVWSASSSWEGAADTVVKLLQKTAPEGRILAIDAHSDTLTPDGEACFVAFYSPAASARVHPAWLDYIPKQGGCSWNETYRHMVEAASDLQASPVSMTSYLDSNGQPASTIFYYKMDGPELSMPAKLDVESLQLWEEETSVGVSMTLSEIAEVIRHQQPRKSAHTSS